MNTVRMGSIISCISNVEIGFSVDIGLRLYWYGDQKGIYRAISKPVSGAGWRTIALRLSSSLFHAFYEIERELG